MCKNLFPLCQQVTNMFKFHKTPLNVHLYRHTEYIVVGKTINRGGLRVHCLINKMCIFKLHMQEFDKKIGVYKRVCF